MALVGVVLCSGDEGSCSLSFGRQCWRRDAVQRTGAAHAAPTPCPGRSSASSLWVCGDQAAVRDAQQPAPPCRAPWGGRGRHVSRPVPGYVQQLPLGHQPLRSCRGTGSRPTPESPDACGKTGRGKGLQCTSRFRALSGCAAAVATWVLRRQRAAFAAACSSTGCRPSQHHRCGGRRRGWALQGLCIAVGCCCKAAGTACSVAACMAAAAAAVWVARVRQCNRRLAKMLGPAAAGALCGLSH